jgi:site-specific recombinase XerD
VRLTLRDVDTDVRLLRIVLGKGRKDRTVPLTRSAAVAIEVVLVSGRRSNGV